MTLSAFLCRIYSLDAKHCLRTDTRVLRHTTLYTFIMLDNEGVGHEVQAYGIDKITEDSVILDLSGVKTVFPGAPAEVYDRPAGPIDILIGSMYKNIQPYGGEEGFTKGRLRLVKSLFGCGYILTGTHPAITANENLVFNNAKTMVNQLSWPVPGRERTWCPSCPATGPRSALT